MPRSRLKARPRSSKRSATTEPLPFSSAFVRDFRRAPVTNQVAILRVIAFTLRTDHPLNNPSVYFGTAEQHAAELELARDRKRQEQITKARLRLEDRQSRESERFRRRQAEERARFDKQHGNDRG